MAGITNKAHQTGKKLPSAKVVHTCPLYSEPCHKETMDKASTLGVEDPGSESRLQQDFSGSSHTSDLQIGTPVAILPHTWRYK